MILSLKNQAFPSGSELIIEGSSITEGIGSSRITANFNEAIIDDSYSIHDEDALNILYSLIENEGLCLGTSSGINIAGAIKLGKELGPGNTIVTILCDKSDRYHSKLFNKELLLKNNLQLDLQLEKSKNHRLQYHYLLKRQNWGLWLLPPAFFMASNGNASSTAPII